MILTQISTGRVEGNGALSGYVRQNFPERIWLGHYKGKIVRSHFLEIVISELMK